MKFNSMKDALNFRMTENEDNYWIEEYWSVVVEIFATNITETNNFILNECSDEEFYWLSEMFEKIAAVTQSEEFIYALKERLKRVAEKEYNQQGFQTEHMRKYINYTEYISDIEQEIKYAEGAIDERKF